MDTEPHADSGAEHAEQQPAPREGEQRLAELLIQDLRTAFSIADLAQFERRLGKFDPGGEPYAKLRAAIRDRFEKLLQDTIAGWNKPKPN